MKKIALIRDEENNTYFELYPVNYENLSEKSEETWVITRVSYNTGIYRKKWTLAQI